MRVAVTTVQVPFIRGGAEAHAEGLVRALTEHGCQVDLVTMPFRFGPPAEVLRTMDNWAAEDFASFDCGVIDKVICLRFPTYYLRHPDKVVWLLHQHRSVYELFDTPYGASATDPASVELRQSIVRRDTDDLSKASALFTNSRRVGARLKQFNGLESHPLYHPPNLADRYYCGEQLPYIFSPSRLEALKRQELLIRAMAKVRSPVSAVIAGEGGIKQQLERLVEDLSLQSRVRLVGRISEEEMLSGYANALGVFFGPYDEDYGYVTLEAMLSAKPVITCTDSGGPLEFVDQESGLVVEPSVEQIAEAIDELYSNRRISKEKGQAGLRKYHQLDISWNNVVTKLLA
jgi:glycosyltransferase involved in cell wall biosynthesis